MAGTIDPLDTSFQPISHDLAKKLKIDETDSEEKQATVLKIKGSVEAQLTQACLNNVKVFQSAAMAVGAPT